MYHILCFYFISSLFFVAYLQVGEVAALPLPMACTLTHVQANNMYYFIVRSVDRLRRYSSWSNVVNAYVS